MRPSERDWKQAVKLAKHYKALGIEEVYLGDKGPFPWDLVNSVEPGGSHRLDISTDVWFRANHPCGLKFRWTFELETKDANGMGMYMIDSPNVARVMRLLPAKAKKEFAAYLGDCAERVEAKAKEFQQAADRQDRDAIVLYALANMGGK